MHLYCLSLMCYQWLAVRSTAGSLSGLLRPGEQLLEECDGLLYL